MVSELNNWLCWLDRSIIVLHEENTAPFRTVILEIGYDILCDYFGMYNFVSVRLHALFPLFTVQTREACKASNSHMRSYTTYVLHYYTFCLVTALYGHVQINE